MQKKLLCPRTELCPIYGIYVQLTRDDNLGIIEVDSIENSDFYSCKAFNAVMKSAGAKQLSPENLKRLQNLTDCMLINQANRAVIKHRPDF